MSERTCRTCGTSIEHRAKQARFCSRPCKSQPATHSAGRTCPDCDKPITNKAAHCREHSPRLHSKTNPDTRAQIVDAYQSGERCAPLAHTYDISRERVRQIINENGCTPPRKVAYSCVFCGKPCLGKPWCSEDHRQLSRMTGRCVVCGGPAHPGRTWCKQCNSIDPWKINATVALYDTGITQQAVAQELGIDPQTVHRHLATAGRGPGQGHGHGHGQVAKPRAGTVLVESAERFDKEANDEDRIHGRVLVERRAAWGY